MIKSFLTNIFFPFILLLLSCMSVWGNGLHFHSHEVFSDKRTGLNLLEGKKINAKENFTLSCQISFRHSLKHYYGYIFRIINAEKENIDFIYNYQSKDFHDFNLVHNKRLTDIKFDFKQSEALNQWYDLSFNIDFSTKTISVVIDNKEYKEVISDVACLRDLQVIFGAVTDTEYSIHDVPPMSVKNVKIIADGKRLEWKLNEDNGNIAYCTVNKYNGVVRNPQWLNASRALWKKTLSNNFAGKSKTCFNTSNNSLLILNQKTLSQIDLLTTSHKVIDTLDFDLMGSQWIMEKHPTKDLLVFYDVTNKSTVLYNLTTKHIINHNINKGNTESNYFKHNTWWSDGDSVLNVFGGYGHHRYKNDCFALNVYTLKWKKKKLTGDKITPRYLAASADYEENNMPHVYIRGGYGSTKGDQMLSPKNYYDLYRINKNTYKVEQIFKNSIQDSSSVWAPSIITKSKQLYALEFDNHKFNSEAQLVTGGIGKKQFKEVGDKIPFLFHDIKSNIDIYFSAKYQKLFCYTTHEEDNKTHIELFQIDFPPKALNTQPIVEKSISKIWLWLLAAFVLLISAIVFFNSRRRDKKTEFIKPITDKPTTQTLNYTINKEEFLHSSIHFFGGLQIIDSKGKDISSKFSPLLKQLLILIVVAQHQNGKGVSNKKITDTLWYGMPENKARNNRAVNFTKLKQLLSEVGDIDLKNQSGYCKIELPERNVHFGFYEISNFINSSSKDIDHGHFVRILQKGRFLDGIEYEWLEEYKDKITSSIIDKLSVLLHDSSLGKDTGFAISVCDCILMYDSVDEDAMKVKCRTLQKLGHHNSAKNCFTKFTKEYKELYGAEYQESFETIFS